LGQPGILFYFWIHFIFFGHLVSFSDERFRIHIAGNEQILDDQRFLNINIKYHFADRNMERTTEIYSVLWLGTGIMLFLAFGLIFLVLFYQNYFTRMKRKEAEQLLLVSLESEKNERQRIAADLHDSVSGDLVAIRNYLSIMKKNDNGEIEGSVIDELREGIENALENTRQVSYKLMPPLLDSFGLAAAVTDYYERLAQKTGISFVVETNDEGEPKPEIAYELFRVIQEFTTNMLKYGEIANCRVSMSTQKDQFVIEIIDDGRPFHFHNAMEQSTGMGLKNISTRLKVIGAVLTQREQLSGNHFIIILKPISC
jgi:signal transduction histidine kinase